METASRESYLAALDRLRAVSDRDDAARIDTTGEQILAVAELLKGQPGLRRALTDPGRSAEHRVALLRDLLHDRVAGPTLDVLAELIGGRWSSGADLLDGTERLGVDALLLAADRDGLLADVEDGLFRFVQIVDGAPQLAAYLGDVTVAPGRRAELVRDLLSDRTDRYTVRLAELAVAGFGGRGVVPSLTRLVELAAARRQRQVAYVTVAVPLTDAQEERLGARLSEMYDRPVSLKVTVDPQVLGGMSVLVGADLYDGTVRRRLDQARQALAGT